MDLKTYLSGLSVYERAEFSDRCKTSSAHLRNIGYGQRTCGEKLAVLVEHESGGVVTRRDLLPDDWWLIWPELVNDEHPIPNATADAENQSISEEQRAA